MQFIPVVATVLLCLVPCAGPAQTSQNDGLPPVNRFEGSAQFMGKEGKQKDAHVAIRQWTIPARQRVDTFPERGFLLITVRAGKVTTTVDGKQQQRGTDDFWTVPENSKLAVEAGGEAAVLEVISFIVR
jgi:quercetin dioxygenase-like cupin family protein